MIEIYLKLNLKVDGKHQSGVEVFTMGFFIDIMQVMKYKLLYEITKFHSFLQLLVNIHNVDNYHEYLCTH